MLFRSRELDHISVVGTTLYSSLSTMGVFAISNFMVLSR